MRYGSVCSGIEASSAAWHSLGWEPSWFSEIESFPSAVLAQRYPETPNKGDMTKFKEWGIERGSIDVLVGGTPCQAFSVAGLRKGLSDERGNLALTFCEIADEFDPEWVVWENVPGVLSSKDNAFGCFLAGLCGANEPLVCSGSWPSSGVVSGPKRTAAWRVLDAQYFGVAQRRRRVFVLAVRGSGNWACAAALFPISESVYGNSAPRREAQKDVAGTITSSAGMRRGSEMNPSQIEAVASTGDVSHCLNAGGMKRIDYESETMIVQPVADTLTANWHNSNGASAGNNVGMINPVISTFAIQAGALRENPLSGPDGVGVQPDIAYTMEARAEVQAVCVTGRVSRANAGVTPAVTVSLRGRDGGATAELGDEVGNCLRASQGGGDKPHVLAPVVTVRDVAQTITSNYGKQCDNSDTGLGPNVVIAFAENSRSELRYEGGDGAVAGALKTGGGKPGQSYPVAQIGMAVRRLTPRECERLQGFPDDWTLVPVRGKPAADGPRYKAIGNSMAVPVMRWLGKRIEFVSSAYRVAK